MADALYAIGRLIQFEGSKYVENDQGRGACKYGITLKTAKEYDPAVTSEWIKELTADTAGVWYKKHFWNVLSLDQVDSDQVACLILNLAVNLGIGTAVKLVQKALLDLNVIGLTVDGDLGPKTLKAINGIASDYLVKQIKKLASMHYQEVAQAKVRQGQDSLLISRILTSWLARLEAV